MRYDRTSLELFARRLRARFWLSLALGLAVDVAVLAPLGRLSATQHPAAAGSLIAVVAGALGGPLAGLLTATAGGVVFFLAAGSRETLSGALISSTIWIAAAVISGYSVDALRRSRAERQDLAVALAREEAVREVQEERLRLSEILTAALQPRLPPRHGSLDLLSVYKPGESLLGLGGDFLDAIALPDGRLALIIGDVAGHGPLAAALAASLRAGWRALVLRGASAADLMRTLEEMVALEGPEDVFATACLAWVDPDPGRLDVILAGHPRPLLVASGVAPLVAPAHLPLGVEHGGPWRPAEFDLPRGGSLFFYTDGLVEGMAGPRSRERFGEDRLAARLAGMADGGLTQATLARLVSAIEVANGAPLPDDVTALALARRTTV